VISIVDASDLQYVLRPTVYRPVVDSADRVRECHPDATLTVAKGSGGPAFRADRSQEPARCSG